MTIPVLKVKVLPKTTIKGKMDVRFPAAITGANFLTITKANGNYTISADYNLLGVAPVTDPASAMIAVLDGSTSSYKLVSLSSLLTSGLDADLQAIAALTGAGVLSRTGANTWALRMLTGTANEITVTNGDGAAGNETISLPVAMTFTGKTVTGGTFASPTINAPAGLVKGDVGLGNVDNTSDVNKPVSTAQSAALALKANLASPALTGTPTAPTPSAGDNSTKIATTAFVVSNAAGFPYYILPSSIDNTGATDVGAAINTFIQSTPAYAHIIIPRGIYLTSVTILVDNGRTISGVGGFAAGNPATMGSCIQGNLTVSPIVKLDGGTGSQACNIEGVNITRIAGTFGGGVLGLQLWRLNNSYVRDCFISRNAAGLDLLDLNVTVKITDVTIFYVTGFYMQMHAQAIEITCTRVRFGMNGGIDTACTGYLYMDGGGWDTIRFDHCQWNSSVGSVTHGIYFNAYNASNPNGIFRISALHCEGFTSDFIVGVGCTARITRLALANCQINSPGVQLIATAALFDQVKFTGTDFNTLFTFDQQTDAQITGCIINGAAVFNIPNGSAIVGNTFYGTTALQGASAKVFFGSNVLGGALTTTGTGYTVGTNA